MSVHYLSCIEIVTDALLQYDVLQPDDLNDSFPLNEDGHEGVG